MRPLLHSPQGEEKEQNALLELQRLLGEVQAGSWSEAALGVLLLLMSGLEASDARCAQPGTRNSAVD